MIWQGPTFCETPGRLLKKLRPFVREIKAIHESTRNDSNQKASASFSSPSHPALIHTGACDAGHCCGTPVFTQPLDPGVNEKSADAFPVRLLTRGMKENI